MALTTQQLISLLEKTLKYTPVIYYQVSSSSNQESSGSHYVLEYKLSDLPEEDGLLFFVPKFSSIGNHSSDQKCKLEIRMPTSIDQTNPNTYIYESKEFFIETETNDGSTKWAGEGDIIANRMCIFRFRKSTNRIILINSPLYNDATFNSLKVVECLFVNKPKVVNPDNVSQNIYLATSVDIADLTKRIEALENKFSFGKQDPETALADKPVGSIYIKVED